MESTGIGNPSSVAELDGAGTNRRARKLRPQQKERSAFRRPPAECATIRLPCQYVVQRLSPAMSRAHLLAVAADADQWMLGMRACLGRETLSALRAWAPASPRQGFSKGGRSHRAWRGWRWHTPGHGTRRHLQACLSFPMKRSIGRTPGPRRQAKVMKRGRRQATISLAKYGRALQLDLTRPALPPRVQAHVAACEVRLADIAMQDAVGVAPCAEPR